MAVKKGNVLLTLSITQELNDKLRDVAKGEFLSFTEFLRRELALLAERKRKEEKK